MHTPSRFVISAVLIFSLLQPIIAQDTRPASAQQAGDMVTASASPERVRFTAPSSVVQIRLEIYNATGRKLFDNELRGGNVLDWRLRDGQAEALPDGTYLCLVTVKHLSGKLTQKIVFVAVEKSAVSLHVAVAAQMTSQQTEAIGPIEADALVILFKENDTQTTTVLAHNGEDGQITRGRGALSFRVGDFYGGKDSEQMRLTAEGNLGIGISQPQARLDVDGFVRISQGIVFPDGSVQYSASRKTFGPPSQRPGQFQQKLTPGLEHLIDTSGTGTTGKIPKWLDGPNGVLTDSLITEASGNIGINTTPDPRFKLNVLGFNRFRAPNASFYLSGFKPGGNDWVYQTVDDNGVGVLGQTTNGFAMGAQGNTVQNRDKGGWVKAMVYVDPLNSSPNKIIRCYNSQTTGSAVSTPPCGFTYSSTSPGVYNIDFGFPISDRFVSATPTCGSSCGLRAVSLIASPAFIFPNSLHIVVQYSDSNELTNIAFYIIVY